MAFESMFRKASAALAVGAHALCIGGAPVVQAQVRAMAQPTIIGFTAPAAAIPERIVLHGVRFQARSDKIDESSVPVLDYTIQTIKANPERLVYIKVVPFIQHPKQSDIVELIRRSRFGPLDISFGRQRQSLISSLISQVPDARWSLHQCRPG